MEIDRSSVTTHSVWVRSDTLEVKSGGSCNRLYKLLEVDDVSSSLENQHSNDLAPISKITKRIVAARDPAHT